MYVIPLFSFSSSIPHPKAKVIEQDAKAWIFGNSDHFQKICYMAEIEPGFVVKITKEAIKLNCKKVGFSKKKSKRILVDYKTCPVETKNSYTKLLV